MEEPKKTNAGKETVRINLPPKPKLVGESRTTPGGIIEFYKDGNLAKRTLPDGSVEYIKEGRVYVRVLPNGIRESYDEKGKLYSRRDSKGETIPIETPLPTTESKKSEPTKPSGINLIIPKITEVDTTVKMPRAIPELEEAAAPATPNPEEKIGTEDSATPKPEKKPGFFRRNALRLALATGLAFGGGLGAKKVGELTGDMAGRSPSKKILKVENKEKEKKAPIPPAKKLAPEMAPAPKPANIEKAEVEPKVEETEYTPSGKSPSYSRYDQVTVTPEPTAEIKTVEKAKAAVLEKMEKKPAPKTHAEMIAEIQAKILRGENLTGEEADMYNREIPILRAKAAAERTAEAMKSVERVNTTEGGVVHPYNPVRPGGYGGPGGFAPFYPEMKKGVEKNPYHLTDKGLEHVEEIYESAIAKIFPNDTLKNWKIAKDKSAYELLSRGENKAPIAQKSLVSYLKKLKETTGLEPRSGVRGTAETVERYMERALQSAASKDLLDQLK